MAWVATREGGLTLLMLGTVGSFLFWMVWFYVGDFPTPKDRTDWFKAGMVGQLLLLLILILSLRIV